MNHFLSLGEIGVYCLSCDGAVEVEPWLTYWDAVKQRLMLQCPVCHGCDTVRISPATEQLFQRVKQLEQQVALSAKHLREQPARD